MERRDPSDPFAFDYVLKHGISTHANAMAIARIGGRGDLGAWSIRNWKRQLLPALASYAQRSGMEKLDANNPTLNTAATQPQVLSSVSLPR